MFNTLFFLTSLRSEGEDLQALRPNTNSHKILTRLDFGLSLKPTRPTSHSYHRPRVTESETVLSYK